MTWTVCLLILNAASGNFLFPEFFGNPMVLIRFASGLIRMRVFCCIFFEILGMPEREKSRFLAVFRRRNGVVSMKIWFTVTGTCFHYGQDFLEKEMKVRLEKEPDNKYDREAIKVTMKGLGHIGYVANSPKTVIGESWSAGRLYDKIGDTAVGKVKYVTDRGVVCWTEVEGQVKPEFGKD